MSAMAEHYDAQLQGVAAVIKQILDGTPNAIHGSMPVDQIVEGLWPIALDYALEDGDKYAVIRAAITYLEAARRA